jgi:hypothetical protein
VNGTRGTTRNYTEKISDISNQISGRSDRRTAISDPEEQRVQGSKWNGKGKEKNGWGYGAEEPTLMNPGWGTVKFN